MTKGKPKNIAASVRQRLQNQARERKEDFQLVLSRYALERLLHRIGQSSHRDRFVLKGAMLFHLWTDQVYRPTRDIDFLANGEPSVSQLTAVFREICDQAVDDDGLVFRSDSVEASIIKPDQEYQGVRILLEAKLERARIPLQIDIGFGDAITPGPQSMAYPSMLGFPTPIVATYPRETVVAEKFQALVVLGMANSRMKDFFDLWLLSECFEFDGELLASAIRATFQRRNTPLPEAIPTGFTAEFYSDSSKRKQWKAFITKSGLATTPDLADLIARLKSFLLPPVEALRGAVPYQQRWTPQGPWH